MNATTNNTSFKEQAANPECWGNVLDQLGKEMAKAAKREERVAKAKIGVAVVLVAAAAGAGYYFYSKHQAAKAAGVGSTGTEPTGDVLI